MYVESDSELNSTAAHSIDKNASQSESKYQHETSAGLLMPLIACAIDWGQRRILNVGKNCDDIAYP